MFSFSSRIAQKKAQAIHLMLPGVRVYLRPAKLEDHISWVTIRQTNKTYLQPFEPAWPKECVSADFFKRRIDRLTREWERDQTYAFLVFLKDSNHLIGGVNINNVARGAAQFAALGYWLDHTHQGQGLMHDALKTVLDFSFHALQLDRMNAACLPHNQKSRNVLARLGFIEEGFAKAYIQINSVRENHILYGLNKPDFQA